MERRCLEEENDLTARYLCQQLTLIIGYGIYLRRQPTDRKRDSRARLLVWVVLTTVQRYKHMSPCFSLFTNGRY